MNPSTLDLIILIPLAPILALLVTWWLPWERWIPWQEIPKGFLGLYALYAAFAAWHFKLTWWSYIWLVPTGIVLLAIYIRQGIRTGQSN
jgi:hypothetical protein